VVYGTPVAQVGKPAIPGAADASITAAAGDTVFALARRHDVPVRDLIDTNGLAPPFRLRVGQSLVIPAVTYHLVQPGETIYTVSRLHGVDAHEVARANNIGPPYAVRLGERLRVPKPQATPATATAASGPPHREANPVAAVAVAALPAPKGQPSAAAPSELGPAAAPLAEPEARLEPASPPRSGREFLWPVQGKVVSTYGAKPGGLQNDGINIAAPKGAAVHAAEDGVVAYAGNELRGFGNLLLIRHADGWVSAYAHNDALLVGRGDPVRRGQVIAKVGSTGSVGEPQLHFELRQGVNAVDPLPHLGKPSGPAVSSTAVRADRPSPG